MEFMWTSGISLSKQGHWNNKGKSSADQDGIESMTRRY